MSVLPLPPDTPYEPLTERERSILGLIADGLSDREIAERLIVAYSTVKWHNQQIFNKLGVDSRREAVQRGREVGLLDEGGTAAAAGRHRLPAQVTPFVGRERERAEVAGLLGEPAARLVTILAPGGMGKTRLALAAAERLLRQFPNGVYFVPLAPLTSSEQIIPTLADHTGFQFSPNSGTPRQQMLDYLSRKTMLLLDNFEHVLDGAPLVTDILQAAPRVKVLATSREKLNLTGETVYALGGMALPEQDAENVLDFSAVQLFVQSARRVQPDFALNGSTADVVRVCQLAQGMPLALELAAAWIGALSPAEIADEITRSLDFLATTMRDVPERLRSVRAVFESAWARLTTDEQAGFRKLSVFRGGCTRDAAQAVSGADIGTLTGLMNKALLRRSPETGRYEVHELLRQYAEREVALAGESEAVRDTHSRYYLYALHQRLRDLEGGRQLETLHEIAGDIENVRAAWLRAAQRANYAALDKAFCSLWLFYLMRGQFDDGLVIFDQAAAALRTGAASVERDNTLGLILLGQAWLSIEVSQKEQTERLLEESRALLQHSNAPAAQAFLAAVQGTRGLVGMVRWIERTEARAFFEQAQALYQEAGDWWGSAMALNGLGTIELYSLSWSDNDINPSRPRETLQQALALEQDLGDVYLMGTTLRSLGAVAGLSRDYEESERLRLASLDHYRQFGNQKQVAMCLNHLGYLAWSRGRIEESTWFHEESLAAFREVGAAGGILLGLENAAAVAFVQGNFMQAKGYSEEGLALAERVQAVRYIGRFSTGLAGVANSEGNYDDAEARFLRVKARLEANDKEETILCLVDLAEAALAQGRIESARQQLGEAVRIAQELQSRLVMEMCRLQQGKLAYQQGDHQQAREYLETSLAYFRSDVVLVALSQFEQDRLIIEALVALTDIERANRQDKAAHRLGHEAVKRARAIGCVPLTMAALTTLADVLLSRSQPERAAELAAFVRHNTKALAPDRARAAALLDKLQAAETFAAAVERGQAAELDSVIAALEAGA